MLLENLSSQERQLYGLIGISTAAALVLGLLGGLISFSWGNNERPDNWQESALSAPIDTLADFTAISSQSRWFSEAGPATAEQSAEAARKAIEGQPESLKLIGIVERSKKTYALFLPVAGSGVQSVSQFAVGDTLIGDWKVKEISTSRVLVESSKEGTETQAKELLLYSSKK